MGGVSVKLLPSTFNSCNSSEKLQPISTLNFSRLVWYKVVLMWSLSFSHTHIHTLFLFISIENVSEPAKTKNIFLIHKRVKSLLRYCLLLVSCVPCVTFCNPDKSRRVCVCVHVCVKLRGCACKLVPDMKSTKTLRLEHFWTLSQLNWIRSTKRRVLSVQSDKCLIFRDEKWNTEQEANGIAQFK